MENKHDNPRRAPTTSVRIETEVRFMPTEELTRQTSMQQNWLIFMRNCAICHQRGGHAEFPCNMPAGKCDFGNRLWGHLLGCFDESTCAFPRCVDTRRLLRHFQLCKDARCPVCAPVMRLARGCGGCDSGSCKVQKFEV